MNIGISLADPNSGLGGNVIVPVLNKKSVTAQGYLVPDLTPDDVIKAYNAIVHGHSAIISCDNMYFVVNQVDSIGGDITVEFLYFNKLLLTYTLSGSVVTLSVFEFLFKGDFNSDFNSDFHTDIK